MNRLVPFPKRARERQDTFDLHADRFHVLISGEDTDGRFSMIEACLRRAFEPPVHVHEFEDELFVVLEGELDVRVGADAFAARVGEVVALPRGVSHELKVRSDTARLVVTYSPAGFERFLREVARPAEGAFDPSLDPGVLDVPRLVTVGERYGVAFYPSQEL